MNPIINERLTNQQIPGGPEEVPLAFTSQIGRIHSAAISLIKAICQRVHAVALAALDFLRTAFLNLIGRDRLLLFSCDVGYTRIVKMLLNDKKTNVNSTEQDGWTSLSRACQHGHADIVRILLSDSRVDINQPTNHECTPFYIALAKGHTDIMRLLLDDARSDINRPPITGRTPFSYACLNGRLESCKMMLANERTNINQLSLEGLSPLYFACKRSNIEIVELLLANPRIDVNQRELDESVDPLHLILTPFHIACQYGCTQIVRLMLLSKRVHLDEPTFLSLCFSKAETLKMVLGMSAFYAPIKEWLATRCSSELLEIASENAQLLRSFALALQGDEESMQIMKELRESYFRDFPVTISAEIFALIVLLSDNFLKIREKQGNDADLLNEDYPRTLEGANRDKIERFFRIATKLPMELQMVLAKRIYDESGDIIKKEEIDLALSALIKKFSF